MSSPSSPKPSHGMYVAKVIGFGGKERGGEQSFAGIPATCAPHALLRKLTASVSVMMLQLALKPRR